jgi:hypothetical protein
MIIVTIKEVPPIEPESEGYGPEKTNCRRAEEIEQPSHSE